MEKTLKKRIDIIDALRGLAVVLMVLHHFAYNLVSFLNAPEALFSNPFFNVLHYIFSGIFIMLCGVSSRFSHSNIKRGLKTAIVAVVISVVTYFLDMPIIFGVLHLLAFCMLFYGLTGKLLDKISKKILPFLLILLTVVSIYAVEKIEINSRYLWIFGWTYEGFTSYDYFPLFPWIFIFLFGTWLGWYIKENKFPKWFYDVKIPVLPTIGKQALLIYILHQPILYGITMLIKLIIK